MLMLLATAATFSAAPQAPQDQLLGLARTQLERAVAEEPSDRHVRLLLGRVDARAGDASDALRQFQIAAREGSLDGLLAEAHAHLRRAEWEAAHDEAAQAVDQAQAAGDVKHEIDARLVLDYAKVQLGQYDDALTDSKRLLGSPPAPLSATDMARLYSVMGGAEGLKAQREGIGALLTIGPGVKGTFEKAIKADPRHARAWYGLGRYYLEAPLFLGDKSKALRDLTRADALGPDDLVIRAWYVYALHANGKQAQEREQLQALERDFGGVPSAKAMIAELEAGRPPR